MKPKPETATAPQARSSSAPVGEHPARASIGVHPGDARSEPTVTGVGSRTGAAFSGTACPREGSPPSAAIPWGSVFLGQIAAPLTPQPASARALLGLRDAKFSPLHNALPHREVVAQCVAVQRTGVEHPAADTSCRAGQWL
jgi:hypothetical protein